MLAILRLLHVTCLVALAYAIGAIDDRADKGNLMYQSELISFIQGVLHLAQASCALPPHIGKTAASSAREGPTTDHALRRFG